jgi:cell division septum initiation protein DivIVA
VNKVNKHVEQLKNRNTRLQEDNARLKKQLQDLKSVSTRIRRIPRKDVGTAAAAEPEAPASVGAVQA